jgi:hypothetical protein
VLDGVGRRAYIALSPCQTKRLQTFGKAAIFLGLRREGALQGRRSRKHRATRADGLLCPLFFDNSILNGRDTLAAPWCFLRKRKAVLALVPALDGVQTMNFVLNDGSDVHWAWR